MKILYAIQGTGNGHLSRARDIIPALKSRCDLDVLVSGIQADVSVNEPVKYQLRGWSFIFGKQGGVDLWKTFIKSSSRQFLKEVWSLPVHKYDLIINDFEPVSAWAAWLRRKPCISLSHQCAVLSPSAPQPKKQDKLGRFILSSYAPTSLKYGFHFEDYDEGIFTPVIRKEIRNMPLDDKGHFTVYLPSYDDIKLIKVLKKIDVEWQVFSKHNKTPFRVDNVSIQPVNNEHFIRSFATSAGVLCGAGFETPAEALFMKKKLMVIPMKNQYEQHFNAAALECMGVPVLKKLSKKKVKNIKNWIEEDRKVAVDYPDRTQEIIDMILQQNLHTKYVATLPAKDAVYLKYAT